MIINGKTINAIDSRLKVAAEYESSAYALPKRNVKQRRELLAKANIVFNNALYPDN